MPSIITHHFFADEVMERMPFQVQNKIDKKIYHIFAQSFDNLFYYKFLTPWQGANIRKLGNEAQDKKVNYYFKNILEYIKKENLKQNKEVLSYLYGSICHYVLDYRCHPFIIYYTGIPSINIKYRGLHEKMEVNIDAYLYKKKTGQELKKANLANKLLPKTSFSKELENTINYVFKKTFNISNMGTIYKQSVQTGNFLLKYFVTDKTGLKKRLYAMKDLLMKQSKRRYEFLSFHVNAIYPEYLNETHETWVYPAAKEKTSNASFLELYEDSLKEACNIIENIEKYLNNEITETEVLKVIGDNSYSTGLPLNRKRSSKYFKY